MTTLDWIVVAAIGLVVAVLAACVRALLRQRRRAAQSPGARPFRLPDYGLAAHPTRGLPYQPDQLRTSQPLRGYAVDSVTLDEFADLEEDERATEVGPLFSHLGRDDDYGPGDPGPLPEDFGDDGLDAVLLDFHSTAAQLLAVHKGESLDDDAALGALPPDLHEVPVPQEFTTPPQEPPEPALVKAGRRRERRQQKRDGRDGRVRPSAFR